MRLVWQVTTRLRAQSDEAARTWTETLVRAHAAATKAPWEEGKAAKEAAERKALAKAAAKQQAEKELKEAREALQAEAASIAQERSAVAEARKALQKEVEELAAARTAQEAEVAREKEQLAAARTAQEAEVAREKEQLAAARAAYEMAREQTAQEAARRAEEEARCVAGRDEAAAAAAASAEVQAQLATARNELAKAESALKKAKEEEFTCWTKQRKAEERAKKALGAAEKLDAKRRKDAEALAPLRQAVAAAALERSAMEAELEDQLRGARRAQEEAAAATAAGSGALMTEMVGKVAGWAAAAKAAVAKARAPDASALEASAVATPATASPAPAASAQPAAAASAPPAAAAAPPAAAEPMSADAASAALAEALAAARAGSSLENGMMGMMGRAIGSLRTMGDALASHMEAHAAELAALPKRKRRLERLAEATRAAVGMFDGGTGGRVSVSKLEAAVEKVLRFAPPPPDVLDAMKAELGEGESIAFPISDEPAGESDEDSVNGDSSDDDDGSDDDDDDDYGSDSAPSDDEEESGGADGGDDKDYQGLLKELAAGEAAEDGNFLRVSEEDEDEGEGGAEGAGEASTDGVKAEAGADAEKPVKLTLGFYGKLPASRAGEVAAALAACAASGKLQRVMLSFESGGRPGEEGLVALCSAVGSEGSQVEVLGLDEPKRVGGAFLAALSSLIGSHSRLRVLSLGGMRSQTADWLGGAPALGAALSASALTELYLPDCRLTPEAVALLSLRLGSALQRLDLSRNNVGARGAAGLAAALAANASGMRSLSVQSARVKGEGAVQLARVAGALSHLSLPFNPGFDSCAAAALAEALADGACQLKSLDLAETKIKDVGVAAIGRALAANRQTRLKHLNVQDTLVAASGVQALADALVAEHAALVTLELRSNQLNDSEVAPLAAAVTRNKTLRELSLIWNNLGDATARAFAAALPQIASLTELGLSSNMLTDEGLRALCEALPQNQSIRRLTGGTHLGRKTSKDAEKELEKLAEAWEAPGRRGGTTD